MVENGSPFEDAKKWSKGLESNIAESFRCEQYDNTATSTIGGKNGPCVCLSGNRVERLFGNRLKCNSRIEEKIIMAVRLCFNRKP